MTPEQTSYPKISLVTACYNHADFIAETITSVVSQGYPNLEYIVLDDGSTDESWEKMKPFANQLTLLERMDGRRPSPVTALNYGFKKTTGEILMWLNSDDILLPKSLFVIAKIFTDHPEIEWLTGMASTINTRSEIINSKLRLKHEYDFLINNWKIIQQESTAWRRTLWEKTGGYLSDEKKWAFDTELWTRFFPKAEHCHVATPLGAFRAGAQSKSVSQMQTFLEPSLFFLNRFQRNTPLQKRIIAFCYKLCRYVRIFWSVLPDRVYARIPFFSKFCYKVLEYEPSTDTWNLTLKNPFRI